MFRVPLQPVTVPVGEVATFHCDVYSNPAPTDVSWRRNNIAIITGGRYTVTDTQLRIQNVREEDDGSYTCEVTNLYGATHSSARLIIGIAHEYDYTTHMLYIIIIRSMISFINFISIYAVTRKKPCSY